MRLKGMAGRQLPKMSTEDSLRYFRLLRTHPEQYLHIAEETILRYPDDSQGYLDCARYYAEFGGNKAQVTESVQRVARANKAASWINGLRSGGKSAEDED